MPSSVDDVSFSLISLGLLSDVDVTGTREQLEKTKDDLDVPAFLQAFVDGGKLTPFQAERVRDGRAEELVMGNYLLLSNIGEGGMGTVYKALHRKMRRVLALKVMKTDTPKSLNFLARFEREVRAAGRLVHPNVVATYDAGECEHGQFLVMEYIDGSDLSAIVKKTGALPIDEAIDAIRQAATALNYAHQQDVVHRDVKPSNLLRDVSGVVKVADLGLAQIKQGPVDETAALTGEGMGAGTVDFLSPEQARDAHAVDARADIYSLGCTLFYLLSGRPVYQESSLVSRLLAHREKTPPSLYDVRDDLPDRLDVVYQRMVEKLPENRYQSMQEVYDDLTQIVEGDKSRSRQVWEPADATVLIVEQSGLQTKMFTDMLRNIGVDDIHTKPTGRGAMELLAMLPARVVLTSMQLADMTGLELAQRIRDDLRWSDVAIVLMTSDDLTEEMEERIEQMGAVGWLRKPFDKDGLESAICEVIESEQAAQSSLRGLDAARVLVVDDSSVARRKIKEVLQDIGFSRFTMAADGLEAVDAIEEQDFQLIVTDYNMPNMNGADLVNYIRTESDQANVPIVVVTSEYDPMKLSEIYGLGVSGVCHKSFDLEIVRNVVIRLFM